MENYRVGLAVFALSKVFARAKRGRVVEDEVEKVNRRHGTTRHDTAPQKLKCELDARVRKSPLQKRLFADADGRF